MLTLLINGKKRQKFLENNSFTAHIDGKTARFLAMDSNAIGGNGILFKGNCREELKIWMDTYGLKLGKRRCRLTAYAGSGVISLDSIGSCSEYELVSK